VKSETLEDIVKNEHLDQADKPSLTSKGSSFSTFDFQSKNEYHNEGLSCKESNCSTKTSSMKICSDDKIIVIQYNDLLGKGTRTKDDQKLRALSKELQSFKSEFSVCKSLIKEHFTSFSSVIDHDMCSIKNAMVNKGLHLTEKLKR
jgi:hypothetical protein